MEMQTRNDLPEGFTLENDKDIEHMHAGLIEESPSLTKIYLDVSNDYGEVLGDLELERKG